MEYSEENQKCVCGYFYNKDIPVFPGKFSIETNTMRFALIRLKGYTEKLVFGLSERLLKFVICPKCDTVKLGCNI